MSPPNPYAAGQTSSLSPLFDPGELWHCVSIIDRVLVDLPNGGQEEQDVTVVADEPAGIEPLGATERGQPGGILATASHRIRLYWVKGIKAAQKVSYADPLEERTRTFEILAVLNPKERAWVIELLVVEQV